MAQYVAYANYVIFFQDEAEYNFALAAVGGDAVNGGRFEGAPRDAATFFDIPFPYPSGDMATIPKGIYFFSPFTPGSEIGHPSPSGVFVDDTIPTMFVPGQAGVPASIWPAGPDMILTWSGAILRSGGTVPDPDDRTLIPTRRFMGGVELEPAGEGGSGINVQTGCRDSSRTIDGLGFPVRGNNNGNTWTRTLDEFNAAFTSRNSWDRFYFRPRVPGTTNAGIYRTHGATSNQAGGALKYSTTGDIQVLNINNVGAETVLGTITGLNAFEWYLFDIIVQYSDGALIDGRIRLYIDHVLAADFTITSGSGLDQAQLQNSSEIGRWTAADAQVEYDLDDWVNADIPTKTGAESLESLDWLTGSHIRKHYSEAVSAVNWAPAQGLSVNQGHNPDQQLNSTLTSTTASALIEGTTDVVDEQDVIGVVLGPVSAIVGLHSSNAASTDGQVGYSIAGGVPVMTTVNQTAAASQTPVAYRPVGLPFPVTIAPFKIRHTKSADANSTVVRSLQSVIEYIGIWGPEDDPEMPPFTPRIGWLHNCRYPTSAWGYVGPVPDGPVYTVGGTYVGNGTQQTIQLPAPCHFLIIRALAGGSSGVKFFGASLGGHLGTTDRVVPNYPVRLWTDPITGITQFTVTGTNVEINANAVTFQYIAFCDPGMRYNICGAYNTPSAKVSNSNVLPDDTFLPACGFIQNEILGAGSNVVGLTFKGPGNAGTTGQTVNGVAQPNWGSFAAGFLNTRADSHYSNAGQVNFSLWRTTDSICGGVMVQIFSYTGDGAGSRVIPLTPVSLRFPLFALVVPHNAPAFYRDPSHAGANSVRIDNLSNSTTAITAGAIDQITVGITLNANGIVYDVFVIPGDTAGWNNGTYGPPNCLPPGDWPLPPYAPPEIAVLANGGLSFNGQVPLTLLKDVSGIYTLIPGKTNDTLYDRQTGQPNVDVKIPDPFAKTGFIGG